ncbi:MULTISPECIES: hypothetical protein [Kribbella]|uniref:Uncharacterized protein n=1 Tax=Kribbella pratensis TaxID=2512112 RepID=A0ABY2FIE8_9ACTN|nr:MULTISPECIES: hypothetical protein [Kribbella]TDW90848.1 hypothetical protein EV137_4677 [Kribbella pratensis]TDW98606.1 hypothetical protein EV647_3330 [Kribbella sp. VKM Ac-2566]
MPEAHTRPGPRELMLNLLLDKVAEQRFPSLAMLDLVESLLQPDEVEIYVRLLVRRMREENYPSLPIMRRIAELTQ